MGITLGITFGMLEITLGITLGITFGLLGITLDIILDIKVNPPTGVNFAGVNCLTLIDAQGCAS